MRVLCAIGIRDGSDTVSRALAAVPSGAELLLVHVIHTGPRQDMGQFGSSLRQRPRGPAPRTESIDAAEDAAGRDALEEAASVAQAANASVTTRLERGKPEQLLVALARETRADLVVLRAREHAGNHPVVGPPSVGHVARFVVDHAPCDVLLLRQRA